MTNRLNLNNSKLSSIITDFGNFEVFTIGQQYEYEVLIVPLGFLATIQSTLQVLT